MHIPAMDSLRHERVGLMQDDSASMVVKAYVQTDETEERGAYDPIEAMSRPFPMMIRATNPTVVENTIHNSTIEPLSDIVVEYTALLHKSAVEEEWVDELEKFDEDDFSDSDQMLAGSLMNSVAGNTPQTLWRTVFEGASRIMEGEDKPTIHQNPLQDIEGRERYGFAYLPSIEDVDEWTLLLSTFDGEDEEGNTIVTESLWLRYKRGDSWQERPLLAYQSEHAGYIAASPNVEFGDEMEEVSEGFVAALLDGSADSNLTPIDSDALKGTRTQDYLEKYTGN